jgi:hypothetical protein
MEIIEADIIELLNNTFTFPTLPNQFMGFSLGEFIEPIEDIDDLSDGISLFEEGLIEQLENPEEDSETISISSRGIPTNNEETISIADNDNESSSVDERETLTIISL